MPCAVSFLLNSKRVEGGVASSESQSGHSESSLSVGSESPFKKFAPVAAWVDSRAFPAVDALLESHF